MKLTIFAATGGIGRHLLEQALEASHDVTAVVRSASKLAGAPIRIVEADLATTSAATLEPAVVEADAVLSALGPRRLTQAGIVSQGTASIVRAMQATTTRRLVVVSGAGIGTIPSPGNPHPPKHDPGDGFFQRHFGARFRNAVMGEHLSDVALAEDVLRDSGLDWTVVRPPLLTDKPLTRTYRTAHDQNVRRGFSISRADVAHCMLSALDQPDTVKHAIGIAN